MVRYALVDGQLKEPFRGLKGVCSGCGGAMTAKCGSIKIHHWAHQRRINCDPWWEPMTQWHIDWQNQFPVEWREVIFRDKESGEFHRADIHTPQGVMIEFQHSPLAKEELEQRNAFYRKILWVVNGQRFKEQFLIGPAIPNPSSPLLGKYNFAVRDNGLANNVIFQLKEELSIHGPAVRLYSLKDKKLEVVADVFKNSEKLFRLFDWKYKHRSWLSTSAPVFIDFGDEHLYWIRQRKQIGTPLTYLQVGKKRDFLLKYTNCAD